MPKVKSQIATRETSTGLRYALAAIWLVCFAAAYQLLKEFDVITFAGSTEGALGLGSIAIIGVAASFSSCLAVVGGLLLSISATWSKTHEGDGHFHTFKPLLSFNLGRLAGYFVLGGLTGLLGNALFLSVKMTGFVKVALSLVMVILGLRILELIPKKYCSIRLPAFMQKRMHRLTQSESLSGALLLGALTYFVPCGFTQSMQLLALGSGSFLKGGLIMLVFALGTLPALLGISAVSSYVEGRTARIFFMFAGTLSLFLGITGIRTGLLLAGFNVSSIVPCCTASDIVNTDPNVTLDPNGQQIISVSVTDDGYSKDNFTVSAGKPTWIYTTAPERLSGCLAQVAVPEFNILTPLNMGETWVGPFTPTRDFSFMCSMGMFRADVHVQS